MITRSTVDAALDGGKLMVRMANGRWWRARRNGATRLWKRDQSRIYVPIKVGFKICGCINEHNFRADGTLNPEEFKLLDE